MYTVRDIMTPVVLTIPHDKLISEVEGILVAENISGAPLVNAQGVVVGLISKSDIVHFDFIGGDTYATPVNEISTSSVVTINASEEVGVAAQEIIQKDIHRLLVVDDGEMVGILTAIDIVKLVSKKGIAEE